MQKKTGEKLEKRPDRRHCIECNGLVRNEYFYDIWKQTLEGFVKGRSFVCEECESENWKWAMRKLNEANTRSEQVHP